MISANEAKQTTSTQGRFQGSIQRTFLLVVLPLSLLPILIIGSIVFFRSRSLLLEQVNQQINQYQQIQASEIESWIKSGQIRLDLVLHQPQTTKTLDHILSLDDKSSPEYRSYREDFLENLAVINQTQFSSKFREFLVLNPSGEVLISTNAEWEGVQLPNNLSRILLTDEPGSIMDYTSNPISNDQIMVYTHLPYHGTSAISAYLVGVLSLQDLENILAEATHFLGDAQSYLITEKQEYIHIDLYKQELTYVLPSSSQTAILTELKGQYVYGDDGEQITNVALYSFDQTRSLASYTWLPFLQVGLVTEVPMSVAFRNLQSLTPYTFISLGGLVLLMSLILWMAARRVITPIRVLTTTTQNLAQGNWEQRVPEDRNDEIGLLSHTFNLMAEELADIYRSLSNQVEEQTIELQNRTAQLEATAQVAREAAAIRDMDSLLSQTTDLIAKNFGFYHVGIFLIDDQEKFAILQATNSEGGQRMLARGHKLVVGQEGVVGWVADTGFPRIALDVGDDRFFFDNPNLPETRSEIALPLKIQNRTIGILDVQSKTAGAFTETDTEILQIMADQIALAIENARLLETSEQTVKELQVLYSENINQAWNKRLGEQTLAFHFDRVRVKPASPEQISLHTQANQNRVQLQTDNAGYKILNIPLTLRGQSLGTINLRRNPDDPAWTDEDKSLAQEACSQIAIALENARLLEESQRRVAQEKLLSQATARFSQSLNIDTVLQMAVRELGQLSGVQEVTVELTQD